MLEKELEQRLGPGEGGGDVGIQQGIDAVSAQALVETADGLGFADGNHTHGMVSHGGIFPDGNGPGGAQYPMAMDQWENNSRVVSNGNYVMMIVHENCDDIVSEFNALF